MKRAASLLALLGILLLQAAGAFSQVSDYEVIASFKQARQSLQEAIKSATDLERCAVLEGAIGRLESENTPHRTLLGEGLYPESLATVVAGLREQVNKAAERLRMAEESRTDKATIAEVSVKAETAVKQVEEVSRQNEEFRAAVSKLSREVEDLSARIQAVTDENTGLLTQVRALQRENKKDKESIARLQELTDKLTANVRYRDELVVRMMDSLFDEYAKAGSAEVRTGNQLAVAQESDYVSKIVATIDGNIAYVQTARLSPQDVQLIREQQQRITTKWDGIKPYLGKLYPDELTRARDITTVDGRLAELGRSTGEAIWNGMHRAFADQNIPIEAFHSGGELYSRLVTYLDGQLAHPSRQAYRTFRSKVWDSPLKDQWLPLISPDELTAQQRSDLDERIARWDKKITAQYWWWALGGLAVAAAIALTVALTRKKAKPTLPT